MPILTSEDEIDLSRLEKELVSELEKHAKQQSKTVSTQAKLAERISDMNITRDSLNRTMRDVHKQLQMLAREHKSNVHEEDVNLFERLIHDNDKYIEDNNKYLNTMKDLAVRKEYLIQKEEEFAEALAEVADTRKTVIKKALDVEKAKNKMIDGDKLNELDQELNDVQREFDRARDILLKKIEQFFEVRKEINELWLKLKNHTTELS
ncbi:MAG: hypothetical protein GF317_10040 [Candidatus Lokiarchaeota archaeon]|nr:hypothetical protein [Candidatus Lokiarchaeota archaeon]MBD3200016.1 hypothetical protein [Candidatus Lokiarchaeota archaeon]